MNRGIFTVYVVPTQNFTENPMALTISAQKFKTTSQKKKDEISNSLDPPPIYTQHNARYIIILINRNPTCGLMGIMPDIGTNIQTRTPPRGGGKEHAAVQIIASLQQQEQE